MRIFTLLVSLMVGARIFLKKQSPSPITPIERFTRWFIEPVEVLSRYVPGGGGAFVAMSVGFFLCERYFRSTTGVGDDTSAAASRTFKDAAADHFGVNRDFFSAFWTIYRHGMQHQGSPKNDTVANIPYKWRIDAGYPDVPSRWDHLGHVYICINPWGFAKKVFDLFLNDQPRIAEVGTHQLGVVQPALPPAAPVLVKTGDPYP
ncbi:hypothetical protein BH09VER1_BH09VER1_26020 [soil metagenome]